VNATIRECGNVLVVGLHINIKQKFFIINNAAPDRILRFL